MCAASASFRWCRPTLSLTMDGYQAARYPVRAFIGINSWPVILVPGVLGALLAGSGSVVGICKPRLGTTALALQVIATVNGGWWLMRIGSGCACTVPCG